MEGLFDDVDSDVLYSEYLDSDIEFLEDSIDYEIGVGDNPEKQIELEKFVLDNGEIENSTAQSTPNDTFSFTPQYEIERDLVQELELFR